MVCRLPRALQYVSLGLESTMSDVVDLVRPAYPTENSVRTNLPTNNDRRYPHSGFSFSDSRSEST